MMRTGLAVTAVFLTAFSLSCLGATEDCSKPYNWKGSDLHYSCVEGQVTYDCFTNPHEGGLVVSASISGGGSSSLCKNASDSPNPNNCRYCFTHERQKS